MTYYEHLFNHKIAKQNKVVALKLAIPRFLKSLRGINKPCLGCYVRLKDKRKGWVSNVKAYPYCDIILEENRKKLILNQTEFKIVKTPENLSRCATYNYRWWVSCWADIDIRKALKNAS